MKNVDPKARGLVFLCVSLFLLSFLVARHSVIAAALVYVASLLAGFRGLFVLGRSRRRG